jgi:hypothetical protein
MLKNGRGQCADIGDPLPDADGVPLVSDVLQLL